MHKLLNMKSIFVMITLAMASKALDSVLHTKDPVNSFLTSIQEPTPAIYCLVSIEKGKTVSEAKAGEKDRPVKEVTTKVKIENWFNTENSIEKITDKGEAAKVPKTSLGFILSNIDDGFYMNLQLTGKKKVYIPKTEKKEGDGYGIVFDCYTVNDKRLLKRQRKFINCAGDAENFSIMQVRKLGNKYDGGDAWTRNQNDIGLQKLVKPMSYYYIGPLSYYGDGFISPNEKDCSAQIYSSVHRTAITLFSLLTGLLLIR